MRVITHAEQLDAETAPLEVLSRFRSLRDSVQSQTGNEPQAMVHYSGALTSLLLFLREDRRQGRCDLWPRAIATSGDTDDIAYAVSPKKLASEMLVEWDEGHIKLALAKPAHLQKQLANFTPKELPSGALRFGEDTTDVYDDTVVAVMLGTNRLSRPLGTPRFITTDGTVWSSQQEARVRLGSAFSAVHVGA